MCWLVADTLHRMLNANLSGTVVQNVTALRAIPSDLNDFSKTEIREMRNNITIQHWTVACESPKKIDK